MNAQSDPLNKIDPTGLYQSDIHYYMTFFLAVAAGMDVGDARVVALAAQYVDDNPLTEPMNLKSGLDDAHRARLIDPKISTLIDSGTCKGQLLMDKSSPFLYKFIY